MSVSPGGAYSNVNPRYLDPRRPVPPATLPDKEKFPINPQYANVTPRYMSPRRSVEEATTKKPPRDGSKANHSHKPISKEALFINKKLSQIQPRFLDPTRYMPSENSPRRVVERRLQVEKRELEWRSDFVMGSCKYFDDLLKYTSEREKRSSSPKNAKLAAAFKDTPSMVSAYVKEGIPIRHHSMSALIERRKAEEAGEAPAVGSSSRAGSPNRSQGQGASHSRTNSPVNHRHWSHAGSHSTTFSERVPDTMASQVAFLKEQQHVQRFVEEHLNKTKVHPDHVPRVATLAPGFRLQQLLTHESSVSRQQHQQQQQQSMIGTAGGSSFQAFSNSDEDH